MNDLIPIDKKEAIESDLKKLTEEVKSVVIVDDETAKGASALLSVITKRAKRLDDLRLETSAPHRDNVQKINDWFKVYIESFEEMSRSLKAPISEWLKKKEEESRKERERIVEEERKRAEEEAKKSIQENRAHEPVNLTPVIEKPQASIRTQAGLISSKKRWTYEIIDESKVPDEFKTIDLPAITKAVRNAPKSDDKIDLEIPGVRIYQETDIAVR